MIDREPAAAGAPIADSEADTLRLFDEVLKRPDAALARMARPGWRGRAARLAAGCLAAMALYGGAAGLFGSEPWLAAWKAPLIVALSVLLCAPSLYVLAGLVGRQMPPREFAGALCGFLATLGLLLLALMPIAWLFSVSSRSLTFVVWLHALLWILAVLLAVRFLARVFAGNGGTLFLWVLLFLLVSLQAATVLRPVLVRVPGAPLFAGGKLFFFDHLGEISRAERAAEEAAEEAARKAAAHSSP